MDMSKQTAPEAAIQGRPKTLDETRAWMKARLASRTHPMNALDAEEGIALIDHLPGLDGESWSAYWMQHGQAVYRQAQEALSQEDTATASRLFMKASGLYFMGRFPCPDHPGKARSAELERESYLQAARLWDVPARRIAIPFAGRADEGREVVVLLRTPPGVERPPVVVMWGGVDAWKEQMTQACEALLALGIATVAMDNAGTGESPVRGVPDAERQFATVFDWVEARVGPGRQPHGMPGPLIRRILGDQAGTALSGPPARRRQLGRRCAPYVPARVDRGITLPGQLPHGPGRNPLPHAGRTQ